jgi:hypothetical protein
MRRLPKRGQPRSPLLAPSRLKFVKVPDEIGSAMVRINVTLGAVPFGQIWTLKAQPGIKSFWHAKRRTSDEAHSFRTESDAKQYMESLV